MHRDRGVHTTRSWKGILPAALLMGSMSCGGAEPPSERTPRPVPPVALPGEEPSPSVTDPVQLVPAPAEPREPLARPWFQRLGGPQDDTAEGLAVDGAGELTLVWLSTPREDAGREGVPGQRRALTVARYGPDGQSRWSREFPRVRVDAPRVGATLEGEVFLSGNASLDAVDFGLGAAQDGFLVKFSSEGKPLWQLRAGQKAWGLAVDGAGGVLVVGEEWTPGGVVPVLAHHEGEGAFRWTRQLGVVGEGSALHAVALAPSGRALLAGRLEGALVVDGQTFGEAGGQGLVLLAFEADGRLAWGKELRGVEGRVTGLAVAEEGTVVLVGEHGNLLSWAGRTLSGPGAFVLASSLEGTESWGHSLSCGEQPASPVVATEAGGRVVAACGQVLSEYAPEGTPRDSRVLSLEDCTEGSCRVTSTTLVILPAGELGLAGTGRYGADGEAWDQDAFLRLLTP